MAWSYPIEIWTEPKPEALMVPVRKLFQEENSQVPVEFQTFDELIDMTLLSERLLTIIAMSFGALGLLMAAIGIYGAAAYSVSRRLLEVGIRVAVGATKPRILWLFVSEHLMLAFAGLAVGVMATVGLMQFLRAWLFNISALDLPGFAGSVALLTGVSALAILMPALRALKVEPSRLLRFDS
jgi:ABC-type antimicrobial peptide transport system permease subunit